MQRNAQSNASIIQTGYSFYTLRLSSLNFENIEQILKSKIEPYAVFYDYSSFVFELTNPRVEELELLDFEALKQLCLKYKLYLIALSGITSGRHVDILRNKNIPIVNSTRILKEQEVKIPEVITKYIERPYKVNEPVIVIRGNVRTGEEILAPDNSVIVLGNVSSTAKVIASHHIIVLGEILGDVYAGSPKDANSDGMEDAFIYCQGRFMPSVVAINGKYQVGEDLDNNKNLQELLKAERPLLVQLKENTLTYNRVNTIKSL